jgi:hypothetical protein
LPGHKDSRRKAENFFGDSSKLFGLCSGHGWRPYRSARLQLASCYRNRIVFSPFAGPDWNFIEPFVVHRAGFGNCEDRCSGSRHQSPAMPSSHGAVAALSDCLVRFGIRKQVTDSGYKNAHVLRSTVRKSEMGGGGGGNSACTLSGEVP